MLKMGEGGVEWRGKWKQLCVERVREGLGKSPGIASSPLSPTLPDRIPDQYNS
jgi:hypothetical protein